MKELNNVLAPNRNEQRNELVKVDRTLLLCDGVEFDMYGTLDEPLFYGGDVARILNERRGGDVSRKVDDDEKLQRTICVAGQNRQVIMFTENGLYETFMLSRKPEAKKFKKIIKGLLKGLRKGELKLQPKFDIPKTLSGALMLAAKQAEQIELQAAKIKEDAPKVEVAEQFLSSGDYTSMNSAAKIMGIGRNTLLKLLREKRVLISTKGVDWNTPYQKHMKHFKVIVDEIEVGDRVHVSKSTYVRPSGMDYIKKLIEK